MFWIIYIASKLILTIDIDTRHFFFSQDFELTDDAT